MPSPPVHCYGRYHVVCVQAPCDPGFILSINGTLCILATDTPGPGMNAGSPPPGSSQGEPINAGTGNNYSHATDYAGLGAYPIRFVRTYNSGGSAPAAIKVSTWGSQWRGTYDRSITYLANATLKNASLLRENGSTQYFEQAIGTATPPLTTTTWTPNADVIGTLVETGVNSSGNPTGWTYTNEDDEVETYNATGQLVSITNRAGLTQTLTYSDGTAGTNGGHVLTAAGVATTTLLPAGKLIRVADSAGRILQYGYDAVGRVVLMTDPLGGKYHYAYSDATTLTANLTSVTYPDGKIRTYLYGEAANVSATPNTGVSYAHSLTGIVDENGNRYVSWTYGANGLTTSSQMGAFGSGIDHVGMAYVAPNASGNSTTAVTDPRGNVRTYNFSTLLNVVRNAGITGPPCDGCAAAFTYDANGNVSSRTDFNGNTTCYNFDLTRNLELYRVQGLPPGTVCPATLTSYAPPTGSTIRKISTTWNASYRLPLVVAEPLRITTYTYDTHGNLLTKTIQPTTDTTGGAGTSAVAAGIPRTWTYTYDTAGRVLTQDGPRTDVADITTYTYDAQENLSTVKNALGQLGTLSNYDANGHPGTFTDPNGLVTNLVYDPRGRLIRSTTGTETTTYTYDGAGELTVVSLPSGAAYTYTYDAAHRLTAIRDSLGNSIQYTLDTMDKRIKEQLFNAAGTVVKTHSRVFDVLNHLYQDIGAVNQTTTYAYDANGNRISSIDPLSLTSSYRYDALNRLIGYTDANNGISQYSYDGLNQLTQVTDPKTLTTQYQRDGLGNLTQQTSPDTGITGYSDDAAGNILTRTDAKGQVATYTYDALNRVASVTYTGGTTAAQAISYTYDQGTNGLGRLTQVSDVTGTSNYSYDQHGRLIGEIKVTHGVTYTSGYSYDTQGRLSSMTYPSGRVVNFSFDSMGRISQIATTLNGVTAILASSIVYEPFGGVHSFNFGDGLTAPVKSYIRQRDQDGRIASYTLPGKILSIGYDADSRISFVSDPTDLANPANYTYDPLSRLTSYAQGTISQGYSYDADGNRISQTLGTTLSNFSYVPNSNMLASIQTGAITQTLVQDANGATTSDATRQYGYDNRGRLTTTTTAQGVINYEVNALGLRVRKQVPYASTDTLYHYDLQGHLIGESPTGTTQFTKEYIYLGDQPVAVMQ